MRIAEAARAAGIPMPPLAKGTAPARSGPDTNAVAAIGIHDGRAAPGDDQRHGDAAGSQAGGRSDQPVGWLQLGRAYAVLHETDKAADAYDKAMALKPDDPSVSLQAVQELSRAQDPKQPLSPRLVACAEARRSG